MKKKIDFVISVFSIYTILLLGGCTNIDIPTADDRPFTVINSIEDISRPLFVYDIIQFKCFGEFLLSIDGGGKKMIRTEELENFDYLEEGWHKMQFYSSNDSIIQTLYYNKLNSLPSVLVPSDIVEQGRRNLKNHNNNWQKYVQEQYGVNYEYMGYYHTISPANTDENGIPLTIRNDINYYNPVTISEYALSLYDVDKMDDSEKELFLKCADLLIDKLKDSGGFSYDFDFVMHGLIYKAPWYSGMAQGQMMSVLSRAYNITGDARYTQYAKKMMEFMTTFEGNFYPSKGCKVSLEQFANLHEMLNRYRNYCIYEEYVNHDCSYVLNGNIFGLIGLHDYYEISGDEDANKAFVDGCNSIEIMLPYYDYYGCTSYDLVHLLYENKEPNFHVLYAHDCHIHLLDALYFFTKRPTFAKYRDLFISYYSENFN